MLHHEHGEEGQRREHGGVGEQDMHAELIHQQAGHHGGGHLRRHGRGVVEAGVLAHVAAGGQLHHHGEGVDVDGGPADARQREHGVHQHGGTVGIQKSGHGKRTGEHHHAGQNSPLAAHLAGDEAHGQVGHDGRRLRDDEGQVIVLVQDVAGVDGVFAGDGVIAEEPQDDGQQDEDQAPDLVGGQLAAGGGVVGLGLLHQTGGHGLLLHLSGPLRLPDGEQEDHQRRQHQRRDDAEVAGIAHEAVADGGGGEHHAQRQHQNAAGGAHEVDDGVGLGAQGLQGHVGHQGHGGGAEGGHGHQNDEQQHHEENQGRGVLHRHLPRAGLPGGHHIVGVVRVGDGAVPVGDLAADGGELLLRELLAENELLTGGGQQRGVLLLLIDGGEGGGIVDGGHAAQVLQLGVVHEGQAHQRHRGDEGADDDEGRPAAAAAGAFVGDVAEQGQQEQRQHVVQRHDDARPRLAHAELVGQDQGDGVVIGLPEGADEEEGEAYHDGALVVEFHSVSSSWRYSAAISEKIHVGWMPYWAMSASVPSPDSTKMLSIPALTPQAMSV